MKTTRNDTIYFYQKFYKASNHESRETKELIELVIKHPHLNRFAATLPFTDIDRNNLSTTETLQLKKLKLGLVAQFLTQKAFIQQLAKLLEKTSIKILLLKSSAFNGYLYQIPKIRGNSDIDILVHPRDKKELDDILAALANLHDKSDSQPFDGLYEKTWISHKDSSVFIDVHTNLANPYLFTIDVDELYALATPHPVFNSKSILMMCPEHNFIHAGLHIFNDGYLPHHSLIDAIKLFQIEELKYKTILITSRKWGCQICTIMLTKEVEHLTNKKLINIDHSKPMELRIHCGKKTLKGLFTSKIGRRFQQVILQFLLIDNLYLVLETQFRFIKYKIKLIFR